MEIINIIINELKLLTFQNIFAMGLYVATAWFLSHFAKNTVPRLLWLTFGLFLIIQNARTSINILFDADTLFGIGFVLPHISFAFKWLYGLYTSLKQATVNTYYFFVTIYFKIRNFFLWFYSTYKKIKAFFTKEQTTKQERQKEYRQNYGSSHNKERAKSRKQEREEESYSYNDSYNENNSYENNNYSYEQVEKESYEYEDEFKQFFSNNYEDVLGVEVGDDFRAIKKKYRSLVMKYHPDKHMGDEKYTKVMQKINEAYSYYKKIYDSK